MTNPAKDTIAGAQGFNVAGPNANALFGQSIRHYDVAVREGPCLRAMHRQLLLDALEQRPTAAENDRTEHNLIFVDQTRGSKLHHNAAAAHDCYISTWILLEFADFAGQITTKNLRIVPGRGFDCPRDNEFRHRIQALGHALIALSRHWGRPEAGHEVIGISAEQQLSTTSRIFRDKFLPFRITLVRPAHVTLGVREISVERNGIVYDNLWHLPGPF